MSNYGTALRNHEGVGATGVTESHEQSWESRRVTNSRGRSHRKSRTVVGAKESRESWGHRSHGEF
ncbi:hypothetical protein PAECIP111893_00331 [Paenibacillus plantiphilus]|uniref:Uncharacterized protein n=1 Tax=Paenibacillus plantiphilus TaxID=2905650 RepID=A0ABM9BSS9_9BACL|nr:hypothetical protein PAECIP111893_00331 [Paenibacillus plantiphilus]